MGALPVADEATWASGRGLCATQAHRRQGAHRAPQQGDDLPRVDVGIDPYEMSVKEKDIWKQPALSEEWRNMV